MSHIAFSEEVRLTRMGFAVGRDRVLTYRPTWEGGRPVGATIEDIPQVSVDVVSGMSRGQTVPDPSLGAVVNAMFHIQQGQRHLTSPFASPYIDKPIKTFFSKGWVPSSSLDQRILMNDAAMLNYALGLSRGQSMGLIERTYREVRHLVADFATMAARASRTVSEKGAQEDDFLTADEQRSLAEALSDPDVNLLWVIGTGWLCCWHDHMATKKDFSSGILRSWFSQVESPLKVTTTVGWSDFLRPSTIAEIRRIGTQCLQTCWVISDDDGEVVDVLASEQAWDRMFAREAAPPTKEVSLAQMTEEIRNEIAADQDEEEPDDIIPSSMLSLKRDMDSMTPQDIAPEDE